MNRSLTVTVWTHDTRQLLLKTNAPGAESQAELFLRYNLGLWPRGLFPVKKKSYLAHPPLKKVSRFTTRRIGHSITVDATYHLCRWHIQSDVIRFFFNRGLPVLHLLKLLLMRDKNGDSDGTVGQGCSCIMRMSCILFVLYTSYTFHS